MIRKQKLSVFDLLPLCTGSLRLRIFTDYWFPMVGYYSSQNAYLTEPVK